MAGMESLIWLFAATWPLWVLGPAIVVIEFAERGGRFTVRQLFVAMTIVALLLGVITGALK
jgi:hypothetical protein